MIRQVAVLAAALVLPISGLQAAEIVVPAWVQHYTNGAGYFVVVDKTDNIIVAGQNQVLKYSSAGLPLWTNYYGCLTVGGLGPKLALDASDNLIVAGYGFGLNDDYATVKYTPGGLPVWTNYYDSSSIDLVSAVAVDHNNDVIVTGRSAPGLDMTADYATVKYSADGLPLWTNRYRTQTNSSDEPITLAVDRHNNVVVTGTSATPGILPGDYSRICVTIKYSSGGVPLWTNLYTSATTARALALDSGDNVIVAGWSSGGDYATIKYSSSGAPLWVRLYGGPGNGPDYPIAVAVDGQDNVVVAGSSAITNQSPYLYDYATIKYSAVGVPLWTNRYNGPGNRYDQLNALALDARNNVVVTGGSGGTTVADWATIMYSSDGVPQWTNRYSGPGGVDYANALALDSGGNVIVTGFSESDPEGPFVSIKYVRVRVPSPVLSAFLSTNNTLQVRVDDLFQPGTLVLEACTDLISWSPALSNTAPTNVVFYSETNTANRRFYRAFQYPRAN